MQSLGPGHPSGVPGKGAMRQGGEIMRALQLFGWRALLIALSIAFAHPVEAQSPRPSFPAFLQSLWPQAQAAGVSRATFDTALSGLTLDTSLGGQGPRQSEFLRPMKGYVA